MSLIPSEKRCAKCGEVKNLGEFHRNRNAKDGRQSRCKPCTCEDVKAQQAKRRAEIGDEAFKAERRASVNRHRSTEEGRAKARLDTAINHEARRRLVAAHEDEYHHLLTIVRREMTDDA